jgi:S-formylglutathione hydrolase
MSGTWTSVDVAGKPADVYDLADIARPRFGLLALPDFDGQPLRHRQIYTNLLDELQFACICPQGGPSWWLDRICREFDATRTPERYLMDEVLASVGQRWGLAPPALGLHGIGMGGEGALRLAFKHPEQFPVAAALAPALDFYELYGQGTPLDSMYDSKEQCRQDIALLHIHPSRYPPHLFFAIDPADRWFRGNDRLDEKLTALGIPHEKDFQTHTAGQPEDYLNRLAERALRFVKDGLEQQSRRLL